MTITGVYSVRACFTGSIRGEGPYKAAGINQKDPNKRKLAFEWCKDKPEFSYFVKVNKLSTFYEIMVEDPANIDARTQNEIITKFYGKDPIPMR